nr:unnamed protein product [Digitaria exilis]
MWDQECHCVLLDPPARSHRAKRSSGRSRSGTTGAVTPLKERGDETTMSALKFCRECNNMLYPREDKETRTLLYACQSCDHEVDPVFLIR